MSVPMDRLWATWRMGYVKSLGQSAPGDACVFCEIPKLKDGPENLIVHRGQSCFVVLNLYPYNSGHAMVVPFRHAGSLGELSDAERGELLGLAAVLERALSEAMNAQGYNLGMNLGRVGGAGIPGHLHLHFVPRWAGDTNFMPVACETKVLPEALPDTYQRVRDAVRKVLGEG